MLSRVINFTSCSLPLPNALGITCAPRSGVSGACRRYASPVPVGLLHHSWGCQVDISPPGLGFGLSSDPSDGSGRTSTRSASPKKCFHSIKELFGAFHERVMAGVL
jgi:hypothetical protein